MSSLWKLVSNIILILAFLSLAVFSLTEYSADKVNQNLNDDKLPLAKIFFSELGRLMFNFEKMPVLSFLPIFSQGIKYENIVNDYKASNQDISPNIKENFSMELLSLKNDFSWQFLGQRLKHQLSKNWSQP